MRNPALRLIGFAGAAVTFVCIFAVHVSGEAQRQALVKSQKTAQLQKERMRARTPVRAPVTRAVEQDYRSTDYDSVRYQPEIRTYEEPRAVILEADDRSDRYDARARYEDQRRADADADRLNRQLDSRLYER